jgi:hypothetical protein
MAENTHKKRRMSTIVGWFSVIAGILLIAHNAFMVQHLIRAEEMDTPRLLMIALRVAGCLAGVALAFLGHKRLRRDQGAS